jgi:hypothetical protein
MRLSSMGQLAVAFKESFTTITVDRHIEDNNIKRSYRRLHRADMLTQ